MANVVKKAVRGYRKEMISLYEANKQKVSFIAQKLLLNDEQAAEAAQWVWENIWDNAAMADMSEEKDFTLLAVKMVTEFCKKYVQKQKIMAFAGAKSKTLYIERPVVQEEKQAYNPDLVLSNLPELHRFVLVLHNVGGMSKMQMAISFKLEHHVVQEILSAAEENVDIVLEAVCEEGEGSYRQLKEDLTAGEMAAVVPEVVEKAAMAVIDKIATQAEGKDKKLDNIFSVLLLAVAVIAVVAFMFRDNIKTAIWGETVQETVVESVASEAVTESKVPVKEEPVEETEEVVEELPFELLDEALTYYADVEIEGYGMVVIELNQSEAPITAANFVHLAESGFYDGLTFHRIVKGYLLQGGDPNGDGTGGSDYQIKGEFKDNGVFNELSHTRGAVSMARSDDYDSASSQFFIVQEKYIMWNGYYAVFGYVVEGMEYVDEICNNIATVDSNGLVAAENQPVITSVTIRTVNETEVTADETSTEIEDATTETKSE